MNALQIMTIFVSAVVAGEATVLAVGMHLIKKSQSPWISLKNDLLLALDIVAGLLLIVLAYTGANYLQPVWFPVFVIIGLLTHLFRIWEYLSKRERSFCGNRPLFVVNNLKFLGLSIILVWGLFV